MILTLDLGSKTGWAAKLSSGRIDSGVADFTVGAREGGGMRYVRFGRWLADVAAQGDKVEGVYFERVLRHVGTSAAHVYGGLVATLTAWCEVHAIPYTGIHWALIKKHATGNGAAKKPEIVAAMRALGFRPSDDNEADALALLHYVLAGAPVSAATSKRKKKTTRSSVAGQHAAFFPGLADRSSDKAASHK